MSQKLHSSDFTAMMQQELAGLTQHLQTEERDVYTLCILLEPPDSTDGPDVTADCRRFAAHSSGLGKEQLAAIAQGLRAEAEKFERAAAEEQD
jgi:hypothetical protein